MLGFTGGNYDDPRSLPEAETGANARRTPEERYTHEQQEFFRLNREESLKLCAGFQAFYAANPAYHLDL